MPSPRVPLSAEKFTIVGFGTAIELPPKPFDQYRRRLWRAVVSSGGLPQPLLLQSSNHRTYRQFDRIEELMCSMFAPDMSWEHFEWLERAIGIPCFTGDNLGNYSC